MSLLDLSIQFLVIWLQLFAEMSKCISGAASFSFFLFLHTLFLKSIFCSSDLDRYSFTLFLSELFNYFSLIWQEQIRPPPLLSTEAKRANIHHLLHLLRNTQYLLKILLFVFPRATKIFFMSNFNCFKIISAKNIFLFYRQVSFHLLNQFVSLFLYVTHTHTLHNINK